jgi:NAD(P)-dependent dehydrogenase (short-subunit alcohol dehydrogenase family)
MKSLFDLSTKTAIVTGASRGIGRAIAKDLALHGASVAVSSRKLDACQAVVDEIQADGGQAKAIACHIGRKDDLQSLVDQTLAWRSRVDILVCNAAINPYYGPSRDISDEVFDKTISTNVRSVFWLCNMVLPQMVQCSGGAITIISSISGLQGSATLGAYAISKAADMQLARNLALEWGPHNIRVNCIAPGLIKTDFSKQLWSDAALYEDVIKNHPLRRIGTPRDISGAVVFLASEAGQFLTGQTIVIDGGGLIVPNGSG